MPPERNHVSLGEGILTAGHMVAMPIGVMASRVLSIGHLSRSEDARLLGLQLAGGALVDALTKTRKEKRIEYRI